MNDKRRLSHEKNFAKRQNSLAAGQGQYIFENNTKGDLILSRPTSTGRKEVGMKEQFLGDNYYFYMVKTGELKLIKEVNAPAQPTLITEIPPAVTNVGPVEVKMTERKFKEETLLTESPIDGITVI